VRFGNLAMCADAAVSGTAGDAAPVWMA
jgi:hypothetical protein